MSRELNTPEKIVTRHEGAYFYCVACHKEYRQCKCKVYVSVDTLSRKSPILPSTPENVRPMRPCHQTGQIHPFTAQHGASCKPI